MLAALAAAFPCTLDTLDDKACGPANAPNACDAIAACSALAARALSGDIKVGLGNS